MKFSESVNIIIPFIYQSQQLPNEVRQAAEMFKPCFEERKWTKDTIPMAIKDFAVKNKRVPLSSELGKKTNTPSFCEFSIVYGISYTEWLKQYSKQYNILPEWRNSFQMSDDEMFEIFKSEYERIKPASGIEYDKERLKCYPTWQCTAHRLGFKTWGELIVCSGYKLKRKRKVRKYE